MEPKAMLPNPSSLPPHAPPQFSFTAYPLVVWSCSKCPSLGMTALPVLSVHLTIFIHKSQNPMAS